MGEWETGLEQRRRILAEEGGGGKNGLVEGILELGGRIDLVAD